MNEELVKALREHSKRDNCNCDTCFAYDAEMRGYTTCSEELTEKAADAIENTSKAYQMMAEAYEAEVTKQEWIPVTERLPEGDDDVIIYGEWTGASGTKYREIWLTDLNGFLRQGYKPIAWMPLPEPPKEETE